MESLLFLAFGEKDSLVAFELTCSEAFFNKLLEGRSSGRPFSDCGSGRSRPIISPS